MSVCLLHRMRNPNHFQLHSAASNGRHDDVKRLLVEGFPVNSRDHDDRTPLHCAASSGHPTIAQLLIDCGADCSAITSYRWTPLHISASRGDHVTARKLITSGCDMEVQDYSGRTALHIACLKGNADVVDDLVARGCCLETRTSRLRMTPLLEALSFGHVEIAMTLLRAGCDPAVTDRREMDPLMYALNGNYEDSLELLAELLYNGACLSTDHIAYIKHTMGSNAEPLLRSLQPYAQTPSPLTALSRRFVRRQLLQANGHRNILPQLSALPLPQQLQTFIGHNVHCSCCRHKPS